MYLYSVGQEIVPVTMTAVARAKIAENNDYFDYFLPTLASPLSTTSITKIFLCVEYLRVVKWKVSFCFRQNFSVLYEELKCQ